MKDKLYWFKKYVGQRISTTNGEFVLEGYVENMLALSKGEEKILYEIHDCFKDFKLILKETDFDLEKDVKSLMHCEMFIDAMREKGFAIGIPEEYYIKE